MINPVYAGQTIADFKARLETLTTGELLALADQSGIDIPPDLDRPFIIRELLDNEYEEASSPEPPLEELDMTESEEPVRRRGKRCSGKRGLAGFQDLTLLSHRYQAAFLEVLPRDPQWVYVFWEIGTQDRERIENSPRFEGYVLKSLELRETTKGSTKQIESFTIPVGIQDSSWYVSFPSGGTFQMELWARGLERSLVLSRPFALPRFLNTPGGGERFQPLIELSGAADFAVLHAPDRVLRRRL
ncbi:MAG: DUF4912 domain-containing protein [Treponema sp.]|jgi:hypothetical protein|nr:DUF4912 domain-containing protein [Treponema sp.]